MAKGSKCPQARLQHDCTQDQDDLDAFRYVPYHLQPFVCVFTRSLAQLGAMYSWHSVTSTSNELMSVFWVGFAMMLCNGEMISAKRPSHCVLSRLDVTRRVSCKPQ